ncbi:hypothetical protein SEVIR_3G196250v4 [Setaria viridis]
MGSWPLVNTPHSKLLLPRSVIAARNERSRRHGTVPRADTYGRIHGSKGQVQLKTVYSTQTGGKKKNSWGWGWMLRTSNMTCATIFSHGLSAEPGGLNSGCHGRTRDRVRSCGVRNSDVARPPSRKRRPAGARRPRVVRVERTGSC